LIGKKLQPSTLQTENLGLVVPFQSVLLSALLRSAWPPTRRRRRRRRLALPMGKTARTARRAVSVLSHLFAAFAAFQAGLVYDIHRGARDLSTTSCRYYGAWRSFSDNPHRQQDAPRGVPPGSSLIPSSITKLMVGASTLNVFDFAGSFPSGFSNFAMQDPKASNVTKGHSHVLLLHQHPSSLPPHQPHRDGATASTAPRAGSWSRRPHLPLPGAASRCRVVKHVLTNLGNARGDRNRRSCTALVGQRSDSYHVNKWLNDPNITRADRLVRVNRYQYAAAHNMFNGLFRRVPDRLMRRDGLKILGEYLSAFDGAMERLGPVAARVADAGSPAVRGNIIVLVCNFGHAELFANFVCAARAGGVDLSKMLMFATDPETHELAMSLGIASFHDAGIFASIPRDASRMYGNDHYAKIMMSKVYCVHMISQLGYNLLFQDVDIMIYQANYLEWFVEKAAAENHDIFFQHDFSDRAEYAPWYVVVGQRFVWTSVFSPTSSTTRTPRTSSPCATRRTSPASSSRSWTRPLTMRTGGVSLCFALEPVAGFQTPGATTRSTTSVRRPCSPR
jgi:hypothetical protein